jgi:hypothetical protein
MVSVVDAYAHERGHIGWREAYELTAFDWLSVWQT